MAEDSDEPVGYDGFGAPLYEHQIGLHEPADFVSLWPSVGWITPDDIAIEAGFMKPGTISPEYATDDDLPGMWSKSDFEGGDPDERSYAERGWVQRYVTGVEPDSDVDFEILRSNAIWTIPRSVTFEVRNVDPELMELIYGQPVIPLCRRQIPERGTE